MYHLLRFYTKLNLIFNFRQLIQIFTRFMDSFWLTVYIPCGIIIATQYSIIYR